MSDQGWRILTAGVIFYLALVSHLIVIVGSVIFLGHDAVACFQVWNFRGAVGIPTAVIASLGVVSLLAAGIGGDFKINLWGLSLEGPAAPITMWVVCFLCIILAFYVFIPEVKTVEGLPPVLAKFCSSS